MPFTPDSELDLLFPANLIPQEVKDQLHSALHVSLDVAPIWGVATNIRGQIRPLASTDYKRGHLQVLSVLTVVTDPGEEAWVAQFYQQKSCPNTYYTLVVVDKDSDKIVGVRCVFIERKFLRGLGSVGHIEDIAVDKNVQGKKIGLRIIQALTGISENSGCYKTILNCSDANIREFSNVRFLGWLLLNFGCGLAFYVKCGYEKKENEMVCIYV